MGTEGIEPPTLVNSHIIGDQNDNRFNTHPNQSNLEAP